MIPRAAAGALVLALAISSPAAGLAAEQVVVEERRRPRRPWYVPDRATFQLAGQIGFLSSGVGWELGSPRVALELFLGWAPTAGEDIYAVTGKVSLVPWHVHVARRTRIEPLRIAAQATYTLGSQYFLGQPGHYPSGYYDLPTAMHFGVAAGGSVVRTLRRGREVGVYYELVAMPTMLHAWWQNPRVVDARDVVSLALGTIVRF